MWAETVLYRMDMEDYQGVAFCEDCGQDALGHSAYLTAESNGAWLIEE